MRLPPHRAELPARGVRAALLRPFAALRSESSGLLYLLGEGHGWILRAALRARALIARIRPDVIVSTSPPHPTHLAAWLATRGSNVRWIADLRDPWAGPMDRAWEGDPMRASVLARTLTVAAERLVVESASAVLTTTRELTAALSARYPGAAIAWVPNAVDAELLPARSAQPFPGLAIAHVGSVYGRRDLKTILRALRSMLDRHPSATQDGTMLRQAGHVDVPQAAAMERDLAELRLGNHVELRGMVPRAQALELLARSRLALVLDLGPAQIPAKLYESVAMGIPTLVVAPRDSATWREATRLGTALAEPDDVEGIAAVLGRAWSTPLSSNPRGSPASEASDYRALAPSVSALLAGDGHGCEVPQPIVTRPLTS
jgi:glycosyltransferase involved in cell wall biosynthesis